MFLLGEFHGQRSLAGYSPWGDKESDTTELLTLSLSGAMNSISELNGLTKFQLRLPSTLENGVSGDTGIIYIRLPHSRDGCQWSISTPGIAPLGLTKGSDAEQAFWDSAPCPSSSSVITSEVQRAIRKLY